MRGFNRAIIAGNLTRDPDLRYTVNKRAYARFTVAVNYRYKNANGEYQDGADYINIVAWGNLGETCGKYLKKGSPVLIEGRISTSTFDARDGSGKKYMTEVMADNMVMLGSREQGGSGGYSGSSSSSGFQSSGMDDASAGGYISNDEDFGKSIGESGFGGANFPSNFANESSGMSDSINDTDIPF